MPRPGRVWPLPRPAPLRSKKMLPCASLICSTRSGGGGFSVLCCCILRGFQKVNFPATSRKCLHPDFAQSFSFTFNAQPSEIKRGNIYNFLTKFKTVQNNLLNNQNFLKLALVIWAKFFQASYSAEQQSHLSAAPHPPTHPKQTRKNCQI